MIPINFIGDILGSSGYQNHARGLFNALYKINPHIHLVTHLSLGWELAINDNELKAISTSWFNDGITICITMPQFWDLYSHRTQKAFYGFCVWEGDMVPLFFIDCMVKTGDMDKFDIRNILVPSKHVRDAILSTCKQFKPPLFFEFISKKIIIIPHGVNIDAFLPQEKQNESFVFIADKGWAHGMNDRGGVQFLIKAYCEEFKSNEKVALNIKINPAYLHPGWDLHTELRKLNLPNERPPLYISTNNILYKDLPLIYNGDCFISPTMGEAFGLGCAQALSCGLPIITTKFNGQPEFINEQNGWLIDSTPIEVEYDWIYEGISWNKPNLNHLKTLMRYAYEHPEECKRKGIRGRQEIINNWQWKHSAEKLLNAIQNDKT